jgi:hypothetical protein
MCTEGDEVIGGWRRLYNKELRNLYSSPSIIRMLIVNNNNFYYLQLILRATGCKTL